MEILKEAGVDPSPDRAATSGALFLRAEAILACDFIETVTLSGQRQYILAVSEATERPVSELLTSADPAAAEYVVRAGQRDMQAWFGGGRPGIDSGAVVSAESRA